MCHTSGAWGGLCCVKPLGFTLLLDGGFRRFVLQPRAEVLQLPLYNSKWRGERKRGEKGVAAVVAGRGQGNLADFCGWGLWKKFF